MSFDPFKDGLATEDAAASKGFDPFTSGLATEEQGTVRNIVNAGTRGALSEGLYSGIEGGARIGQWLEADAKKSPETTAAASRLRELHAEKFEIESRLNSRKERDPEPPNLNALLDRMAVIDRDIPAAEEQAKAETANRFVGTASGSYADAVQDTRQSIRASLPIDPEFEQSLGGQIIAGIGQAAGTLPLYAVPGAGPGITIGQMYQQSYDDARSKGADEAAASEAGFLNVPAAALDVAMDRMIIGRVLKPLKGRMTVGQVAKAVAASSTGEGSTEAAQQVWQNLVATKLAGYDPDRPLDDQVINSLIVGAVVGGTVSGVGQAATAAGRSMGKDVEATAPQPASVEGGPVAQELPPRPEPAPLDAEGAAAFDPFKTGEAEEMPAAAPAPAQPVPEAVAESLVEEWPDITPEEIFPQSQTAAPEEAAVPGNTPADSVPSSVATETPAEAQTPTVTERSGEEKSTTKNPREKLVFTAPAGPEAATSAWAWVARHPKVKSARVVAAADGSQQVLVVPRGRSFRIAARPDGVVDVLDALQELGGVAPPPKGAKGGEWDGFRETFGSGLPRLLVRGKGRSIDTYLSELESSFGLRYETVDEMYDAVKSAVVQRKRAGEAMRAEDDQAKLGARFDAAAFDRIGRKGIKEVPGDTLSVGMKFALKGEPFEVTDINPDTGDITVRDGPRFGTQVIPAGSTVAIDKSSLRSAPRTKPTGDAPFARRSEDPSAAEFAIRAYHGTPHKVDRFSTEKVGTGEGGAAYGWGLYFAQNPDVAEQYRRNLTQRNTVTPSLLRDYFQPGRVVPSYSGFDRVVEFRGDPADKWNVIVEPVRKEGDKWVPTGDRRRSHSTVPTFAQAKEAGLDVSKVYQVELAADPEQLLEWDKRLTEQPPAVLAVLQAKFPEYFREQLMDGTDLVSGETLAMAKADPEQAKRVGIYTAIPAQALRGREFYNHLARDGADTDGRLGSQRLAESGIPGIRYFDEGSRRNIRILSPKESVSGKWVVGEAPNGPNQFFDREEAARAYFAQEEARRTSNFVIFDDKHVRILEENGVAVQTAAEFAQRGDNEKKAARREQLAARQAQWRANAERIAPGLMQKFRLQFGDPEQLVQMGRAERRSLTGYEEAAYLAHERLLFLFDQALGTKSELNTRINLLHEMGHAHWDTLPVARHAELIGEWRREISTRTGPLFMPGGIMRRGVAQGVDVSVKEWYAERIAWANHRWAQRREGGPAAGDGLIGRLAQQFRQLLLKLRETLEQLRGAKIDTDFRTFLDQGPRFDAVRRAAPALVPEPAFARRLVDPAEAGRDTRAWIVRNFTSAGGLPPEVFKAKLAKDGRLAAVAKQIEFALRDADRAMHVVYGGPRAMTVPQMRHLNDVLGGKAPLASVDPRLQAPLGTMRNQIDILSRRLVLEGAVDANIAAKIAGNVGFYLNRSYRKFDDPKWAQKVPEAVLNRARTFVAAQLQAKNPLLPVDPREVEGYVQYLLSKDVAGPEALFRAPREGAKDLRVLTPRKDIPDEIRALFGEYEDPRVNYLRSVAKTAQILESHQFLEGVRRMGLGNWLFDRPVVDATGSYVVPIAPKGSDTMGALAGLYTTPEIARAFQAQFAQGDDTFRWWVRVNSWAKISKTVLSPVTQVRNLAGNLGFLVANGHWRATAGREVFQALRAEFGRGATPTNRAYLSRLARLGVVGESVASGEVREALSDAGARMQGFEEWTDSRLVRLAKAPFSIAARLYRINDEIFKIYAFENERRAWSAADPALTADQLDTIAAERVRNTLPTYSLIPRAVQAVRRYALTGSFVSFPSEIARTTYHTIKYALGDLRSPNPRVRLMGIKRLGGLATMAFVPAATSLVTLWQANLDEEDERDLRRFLPEWNRNATLYYRDQDGRGRFRLIDGSYLDPWNYLKKPVTALLRGGDWETALRDSAIEAISPFADEGLVTKVMLDVTRNVDQNGRPITNPQAPFLDRVNAQIAHVWQAFEPGAMTQAKRIVKASRGEVSSTGRAYNLEDEVAAVLTGARSQSLDVGQALLFRAKRFTGERQGTELIYREVRDRQNAPAEDTENARSKMEAARAELTARMAADVQSAQRLGVSSGEVFLALRAGGLSESAAALLFTGRYLPYVDGPINRTRVLGDALRTR